MTIKITEKNKEICNMLDSKQQALLQLFDKWDLEDDITREITVLDTRPIPKIKLAGIVVSTEERPKQQQSQMQSKTTDWFWGVLGLKGDKFTKEEIKQAREKMIKIFKDNAGTITEIVRINMAYSEAKKHATDR